MLDQLIRLGVEVLRLVPLILAFFLPAILGMALLKERGERYKAKAVAVFVLGFGVILAVQVVFTSVSAPQVLGTLALSLLQILVALLLAAFTVYKLAD